MPAPGFGQALMWGELSNQLGDWRGRNRQNALQKKEEERLAAQEARVGMLDQRAQDWRTEDVTLRAQERAQDLARREREQAQAIERERERDLFNLRDQTEAEERAFARQKELARLQAALRPPPAAGRAGTGGGEPAPVVGTEGERKGNMSLLRARDSNAILDEMQEDGGARMMNLPFVGRMPWTGKEKQYEQAAENFLSAILRAESGATITEDEMNQAYRTYIPTQWDSEEVRAQKAAARARALEGVQGVAGRAAAPAGPSRSFSPDNPFARR